MEKRIFIKNSLIKQFELIPDMSTTILQAPPGYGKSTALQYYFNDANKSQDNVIHYCAQELEEEVPVQKKWRDFCQLFEKQSQHWANELANIQEPFSTPNLEKVRELFKKICSQETFVIIDDFQFIENDETTRLLYYYLIHGVPKMHLVLVADYLDNLKVELLQCTYQIHYLQQEDFLLQPHDIMSYYAFNGQIIDIDTAQNIYQKTEGWLHGIKNYDLLLNHKMSIVELVKKFKHEVNLSFTKDQQKVLSILAQFDSFTQYILDSFPLRELIPHLDRMIKNNFFITYSADKAEFQLHPILRTYFRYMIFQYDEEFLFTVFTGISTHFRRVNEYKLALEYSDYAANYHLLLEILAEEDGKFLDYTSKDQLTSYFIKIPDELFYSHPLALLIFGKYFYTYADYKLYKEACTLLDTIINSGRVNPYYDSNYIQAEYILLQSLNHFSDIPKLWEDLKQADKMLDAPSVVFNKGQPFTFGVDSILYLYHTCCGKFKEIFQNFEKSAKTYNSISGGHASGAYECLKAEYLFYQGDLAASFLPLSESYSLCINRENGILLSAILLNVKILYYQHRFDEAEQLLQKAKVLYHDANELYADTIDLFESMLHCIMGNSYKVAAWITEEKNNNPRLFFPGISYEQLAKMRYLLEDNKVQELLKNKDEYIKIFEEDNPYIIGKIYMNLILSSAYIKSKQLTIAKEYLEHALKYAMPDNIIMPFIEQYPYIKELLNQVHMSKKYPKQMKKIHMLGSRFLETRKETMNHFKKRYHQSLTAREREVAYLASQGLTNKEIAKKAYISENTVKTHLKSIYKKLDVKSKSLISFKLEQLEDE